MINRIVLNETSYFGKGAISVIPEEVKKRELKKAFVATDKDLIKFNVAQNVTKKLDNSGIEIAFSDVCTPGNPRDTSEAEILNIYKKAFK